MKIPVLRLCFLLAAVSVNFPLMPSAYGEGEPPPFEARFESDAEGTWFVYPTVRGCHYRIESSSTSNPADFVVEPGTFHYGSGSERRWWIAAPPPPAVPPLNPPPPRTYTGLTIQVEVANDQPGPVLDVHRLHPQHPWSARLNLELPLRNLNYPVPFISIGNTPTEYWSLSGTTRFLHLEDFTGVAPPPDFDSNSPEGREYAFLIAHWDELVSNLTPPEAYIPESPNVPPVSTAPPDFSQRRFLRVQRVGVDTNGNSFPDWYEWKYGYNPFATGPAQGGFLQAGLDDDVDGLSAEEEFAAGTSPLSRDTDGDYASDGEEVHPPGGKAATNPLDITSVNLALMSMGAMAGAGIYFYQHTAEGETAPHWRHWLGMYVENPQSVIDSYGAFPWHAVAGGGYPATPEETFGHPDYGQMHTLLGSAAGFSGLHGEIISQPAPLWWLHRPPPGWEGIGTSSTAYPDCEGSLQLTASRSYVRVRAPEDADLLVPIEVRTYAHWSWPDTRPQTPESTEIKYLHVPAGGNVSDDAVDITSTFEVPAFFAYNPYLAPPATIRGNDTEARLYYDDVWVVGDKPVIEYKIIADTNRDGEIDPKTDEEGKATFSMGSNGKGAIIMVNCDDDDGDHFPDNWPGAIPGWHCGKVRHGKLQGGQYPPNRALEPPSDKPMPAWVWEAAPPGFIRAPYLGDYYVNGVGDLKDCGRFRVKRMKNLPANCKVRLMVTRPYPDAAKDPSGELAPEPDYFTRPLSKFPLDPIPPGVTGGEPILPEHRLRIFLPTVQENNDVERSLIPSSGDYELIGPGAGASAVFTAQPNSKQHALSILKEQNNKPGWVEFAVEGIEFAATVDVWLELDLRGDGKKRYDRIRIKCAPFIAASPTDTLKEVVLPQYSTQDGTIEEPNIPFNTSIFQQEFQQIAQQNSLVATNFDCAEFSGPWIQDQYEIGYTEVPAFRDHTQKIVVMLDLPRDGNSSDGMDKILRNNCGLHYRLNYLNWNDPPDVNPRRIHGDTIDFGGNIECTPPIVVGGKSWPHGRILLGTAPQPGRHRSGLERRNISTDVLEFLKAQELQLPLEIPIEWTDLRHIDELICIVPRRNTPDTHDFSVLLASPARADAMIQTLPMDAAIDYVTAQTNDKNIYKRTTNVGGYINGTGGLIPEDMPASLVGATGIFFGATKLREANVRIIPKITALRSLLKNELGITDSEIVELPQLFAVGAGDCKAAPCHACTVNIQLLGSKALTFSCYGPRVDGQDPFHTEMQAALHALGYTVIKMQEPARWFVQNGGGVHCASNKIPDVTQLNSQWWK